MKDYNKKTVEKAGSIYKLATLVCGHGYYAYHNDDRDHPIPKEAIKEYLEMGAAFERQQMTKDAVCATVDYPIIGSDFPNIYPNYKELGDYCDKHNIKDGDKVKVIIIKEDSV